MNHLIQDELSIESAGIGSYLSEKTFSYINPTKFCFTYVLFINCI